MEIPTNSDFIFDMRLRANDPHRRILIVYDVRVRNMRMQKRKRNDKKKC